MLPELGIFRRWKLEAGLPPTMNVLPKYHMPVRLDLQVALELAGRSATILSVGLLFNIIIIIIIISN